MCIRDRIVTDPIAGICVGIADISFEGFGVGSLVGEFSSVVELVDSFVAAGIDIGFGVGIGVGDIVGIGCGVGVGCNVGVTLGIAPAKSP